MPSQKPNPTIQNIREIVFGLEDGLVSTLGTITGVAAGTNSSYIVILTGFVLVIVEALSMAAGSYLSSKSSDEAEIASRGHARHPSHPLRAGFIMFWFYIGGGAIPVLPYLFLPVNKSYAPSIIGTVICLFLVGVWSSRYRNKKWYVGGIEMTLISLSATGAGLAIGSMVPRWFGM